jgi:lysophospholipase L1-like esterase
LTLKGIAFISLLLLIPVLSSSRQMSPYVFLQHNTIQNNQVLLPFFLKLDSLNLKREGKVHIVQIGDSHIQADVMSSATRKRFQNDFGNGGRGFVFPYNIAKSNLPLDLSIVYEGGWSSASIMKRHEGHEFGASGYLLKAEDSAGIELKAIHAPDHNYSFNKLTVFQRSGYFVPEDSLGVKLVAFGGSRSFPYATYLFQDYKDSIQLWLKSSDGEEATLDGFSLENTEAGVVFHSMGTNGSSTLQYLRSNRFEDQIAALQADLIIVSFGTNDCYLPYSRYCSSCTEDRFRKLIKRLKQKNPQAQILLTVPPDHYYRRRYPNKNLSYLRKAMLKLAQEEQVAVWDLYALMGGASSIKKWHNAGLARRDLIHFTKEGYILQGNLLYEAIMNSYEGRYN